jgi:hypothetical protein
MQITFVTGSYRPDRDGVADYVSHLRSHLAQRHISATVLTTTADATALDDVPEPQNPGARQTATRTHPEISQTEARNANQGEGPNGAGGGTASTAEAHVPASSEPEPSDLPTSR